MLAYLADLLHRPETLPPMLGAAVQLALALFLLMKQGEARLRVWFALVTLCSSVWSLCIALALGAPPEQPLLGHAAARVSFAAISLAGPLAVSFAGALTRQRIRGETFYWTLGATSTLIILAVPSWTLVAQRSSGGYWPIPCAAFALAGLSSVPCMAVGVIVVQRAFVALPPCRRRRQLGWSLAAVTVGAMGSIDAFSVIWPIYPLAWATGALSCLLLFYAVAQHRLMAIRTVAREAAVEAVGFVLLAATLWVVITAASRVLLSRALLASIAFVLFFTTRGWVSVAEPTLAKVLGRRRRRIERALAEFARRSLEARDSQVVVRQLDQALREGFDLELVDLLGVERARDEEPILLDTAEALVGEQRSPALRDLLDLDQPSATDLLAALDWLRADAIVPLFRDRGPEQALLGLLVLRGPGLRPADDAAASDLMRLGEQAARALINAQLYEEVELRGRGLEAQVKLRTAELEGALTELKNAQARLVEAERSSSLGLLVAGISHEINNALNFISANLPTLSRYVTVGERILVQAPSTQVKERELIARAALPATIGALEESTKKTGAIVADLRKFARPDTERRLFRLDEGVDAALNLLRRRTDGRLDVARVYVGVPTMDCYPGPLNQCFFNVLLNAVEAAQSEVWIVLRERGERGGFELLVSDDGPGIVPEHLDQVFQPFFTTKQKAAGLGLTVARGVVERHGGSIAVSSQPGRGATVRIRLPARAPDPRQPTVAGERA